MRFKCHTCDAEHDIADISFGAEEPFPWPFLSDAERSRSVLGKEQCEIEFRGERSRYIRARLEIPIVGTDRSFTWGVWCSLSEKSYAEVIEHWNDPNRVKFGPYFGWLCTRLPEYPETLHLKTMVHQRSVGERPLVELKPTDHPLSVDQRRGTSEQRLNPDYSWPVSVPALLDGGGRRFVDSFR